MIASVLVDHVAVRRDAAGDDRLAEPEGALDHEAVALARGRVDREHHARARASHLALDDHGDVHVGLAKTALGPVEDRAGTEQRRPAAAHRVDDGVVTADVEEGLVHTREGGRLGVLGGRRRAHRDRWLAPCRPSELVVGGAIACATGPGIGSASTIVRRSAAAARERFAVVDVDLVEPLLYPPAQPAGVAERSVRGRSDHEAAGHRQPRRGQLSEVGPFAAAVEDVGARERGEEADRIIRGRVGIGSPLLGAGLDRGRGFHTPEPKRVAGP